MESFNLQDWTRIRAMNPFLQRKPKHQRTGAVQDLAEARKHVALACVLECGSPLLLSDERFMESPCSRYFGSKSLTSDFSSFNSFTLASILARLNSLTGTPCTISNFWPSLRTGNEQIKPFSIP